VPLSLYASYSDPPAAGERCRRSLTNQALDPESSAITKWREVTSFRPLVHGGAARSIG
jgi:hypothetical protein